MDQSPKLRWLESAGILVTAATALTYAFGYLSATAAAGTLGVAPADFGLAFPDYVFMASWYFVAIALAVAGFLAQQWLLDRRPQKKGAIGLLSRGANWIAGCATIGVSFIAAAVVAAATGLTVLLVFPVMLSGAFADPLLRKSKALGSAVVMIAILAGGALAVRAGEEWAQSLHSYANGRGGAPDSLLTPGGYLNPTVGTASVRGGHSQCVVRVGTHILVGRGSLTVVDEVSSFTPRPCRVVDEPTG